MHPILVHLKIRKIQVSKKLHFFYSNEHYLLYLFYRCKAIYNLIKLYRQTVDVKFQYTFKTVIPFSFRQAKTPFFLSIFPDCQLFMG